MPISWIDWEDRPAVVVDRRRAWAVLAPGEGWTEVNAAEVADSGSALTRETWERTFAFMDLPALPWDTTTS